VQLLLVEDDAMIAEAIGDGARQNGVSLDHVGDAAGARLALADHAYSAVLLDLGLPGDSGMAVLKWLRARCDATPVVILTARGNLSDRIAGLDAGADDYVTKPFQFDELWARLRAVRRRSEGSVIPLLRHGDVVLDRARRTVTRGDRLVALSEQEFRTFQYFLERPGRIVTRIQLEQALYGMDEIESNTVAVFIHQLRRKLGEQVIRTVHGRGYLLGEGPA
jgi:two-component system, OmpR family, response regulator